MATFNDGESLAPVRAKINATITTVDNLDASGATQNFASRSEVVTWIAANGASAADGSILNWPNFSVVKSSGATEISDMQGYLPNGVISPQHFAENTTPGTTDMTAAVNAAISYASSLNPIDDGSGWYAPVYLGAETLAISDQGSRGIDARGLTGVEIYGGEFVAIGAWTSSNPIMEVARDALSTNPRSIMLQNVKFDCKHLCAGILFEYASQCRLIDVDGTGFESYGVRSQTKATELRMTRVSLKQYVWGETGYDDQSLRTARGFDMNTADFVLSDCVANYCGVPFYKGDGFNWQMIGCHGYNGTLSGTIDPDLCVNLDIQGPQGGVVTNFYNDNGFIRINADIMSSAETSPYTLQLSGVKHAKNENGYQDHELIITTTQSNNNLAALSLVDHRFPKHATDNISFEGSGSYSSQLAWEFIACARSDGSRVTGVSELFNMGGQLSIDGSGNVIFASFSDVALQSERNLTLMADYDNNSGGGDSNLRFGTNATVWHTITDVGFWEFGSAQATGGGAIARASWVDNGIMFAPNNNAGSYNFNRRFRWSGTDQRWSFDEDLEVGRLLVLGTYTVAGLPTAATAGAGATSFVTDATATTFASIVAGGGSNGVPVYSDGTDWRIG